MLRTYSAHLTLAGARPSTIHHRIKVLEMFAKTLDGRQLVDATHHDVIAYLGRPLAAESRRTYRSHLRAFYGWAREEGLISTDPTERVPAIRVPRGTPRPMSDDDLALALSRAGTRMRAWLLLMALAGLRCIEVAALHPEDVILEPVPLLYLRECKGGGTGSVPAHPAVLEALAVLPIDGEGRWWSCNRQTVSAEINDYLRAIGVKGTAHALRHSAGTTWYRTSGHDLITTARLLRHRKVDTTLRYAELDPTRPSEVVNLVQSPVLVRA